MSGNVRECLEMSGKVWKCLKMFRGYAENYLDLFGSVQKC